MGIIILLFIILYLLIDIPFVRNSTFKQRYKRLRKVLRIVILATGLYHGIRYYIREEQGIAEVVSGLFLLVMAFAYMMSGEHSGIEDKVARKTFKIITWFILWILLYLHSIYL